MKNIYWSPSATSRVELVLIALLAVGGLSASEKFPRVIKQPHAQQKLQATRLANTMFDVLKVEAIERGHVINPEFDPSYSGLVGDALSPITSTTGHIESKQTSVNPNFAALIVEYLHRAGVAPGDAVAIAMSGSFPALNASVYAAIETMRLRPVVISSAAASQFGATDPKFTWLDMESFLFERGLISFRSIAASRGGIDDQALGMSSASKKLLDNAIGRNQVEAIVPVDYEDSVRLRLDAYYRALEGRSVKAYINVGGGTASVGTSVGKELFDAGLNKSLPSVPDLPDSVMKHYLERDVPVIHMVRIVELARRWGLAVQPTVRPVIGEGKMFQRTGPNRVLLASVLTVIVGALFLSLRYQVGARIQANLRNRRPREDTTRT